MTGLRWGILATGSIADSFASDLRIAGLNVVAVGSRSLGSAKAFALRHGLDSAYGSYETLVADPDVDIIYVATPHSLHHENARLALEAGKHVLVEKAFTLNRNEAQDLRQLANSRGLLVMEAMWTRYLPHMTRIREIVAEATLGELRAVTAEHAQRLSDDPSHRLNALELGGGALLDLGIYPISFIWDLLGAPTSIHAVGRRGDTGADTEVATVMTHAGGAISTSLSSSRGAGSNTATVIGTRARIEIDRTWYAPTSFRVIGTDGTVIEEYDSDVTGGGMQYEALAAERFVRNGTLGGETLTIDDSVAIMGALDDIRAQLDLRYPREENANA